MAPHLTFAGGQRLTAADVLALKGIVASLFVLAGCESGLVTANATDEPFGLLRGVFFAGARSVVASLWRVPDSATALLFDQFYQRWPNTVPQGFGKAEALRQAMLSARDRLGDEGTPYQWGAFAIHGDWR
jgi:CHAT domain-containing protein